MPVLLAADLTGFASDTKLSTAVGRPGLIYDTLQESADINTDKVTSFYFCFHIAYFYSVKMTIYNMAGKFLEKK